MTCAEKNLMIMNRFTLYDDAKVGYITESSLRLGRQFGVKKGKLRIVYGNVFCSHSTVMQGWDIGAQFL